MPQAPGGGGSGGATATKSKGGVTPKDIWDELESQGASGVQAAAIMGNAIAESSLDPEAQVTDSNGYKSYGLWQFNTAPGNYPQAGSLVTGSPLKDMRAQVKFLISNGGLKYATGQTVPDAASNFASGFERCSSCDSGGASNSQRQSYASEVASWAAGNSWPASAGNAADTATLNTSAAQQSTQSCAWQIGGGELDLLVYHQSLPSLCLLSKGQARALIGAGLLVGGVLLGLVGVVLLASTASGGVGQAARSAALMVFPEARPAAAAVSSGAGSRSRSTGSKTTSKAKAKPKPKSPSGRAPAAAGSGGGPMNRKVNQPPQGTPASGQSRSGSGPPP